MARRRQHHREPGVGADSVGLRVAYRRPRIRVPSPASSAIFLNSDIVGRDRGGSRSLRVPGLALEPPPIHPLAAKIDVLGIVTTPPPPPALGPGGLPLALPLGSRQTRFNGNHLPLRRQAASSQHQPADRR